MRRTKDAKKPEAGMVWMDVAAVAIFLGVSRDTVYRLAKESEIPCLRLGGRWKFRCDELEEWTKKELKRGVMKRG